MINNAFLVPVLAGCGAHGSTIIIISRGGPSPDRIDLVVMGVVPFHDNA